MASVDLQSERKFNQVIHLLRKYPGIGRTLCTTEVELESTETLLGRVIAARERRDAIKRTNAEKRRLKILYDSFNKPDLVFDGMDFEHPSKQIERTGDRVYQVRDVDRSEAEDRFFDDVRVHGLEDIDFDPFVAKEQIPEVGLPFDIDSNIFVEETDNIAWDDCVPGSEFSFD